MRISCLLGNIIISTIRYWLHGNDIKRMWIWNKSSGGNILFRLGFKIKYIFKSILTKNKPPNNCINNNNNNTCYSNILGILGKNDKRAIKLIIINWTIQLLYRIDAFLIWRDNSLKNQCKTNKTRSLVMADWIRSTTNKHAS